jgi:ABC-type branched-subunit amino acid transport system ATPase component
MTDEVINPIVQMNEISKKNGTYQAFDNLPFHVFSGEILALLGLNGAGKKITTNCLLDFLKPDSGNVNADQNGDFTPCAGCNALITLDNFTNSLRFTYQMTTQTKIWLAIGVLFLAVGILLFFASVRLNRVSSYEYH